MAVSYLDRQTLAILAPTVRKALAITETQYGWLVSAFSIAYLVGAPLAGRLVDRVGARRGLLGAVLVWSVVAALHALVPGFGVLFALRILLGLAEAPSFPGAAQTVHRALPPAERARGFGVLFTGSSFGAMVAPILATWLEARWGFRVAFVGTAAVGLAWIPMWLAVAYAPAARRALDRRTDAGAAEAGAAEAGTGALALVRHPAVLRAVLVVLASSPMLAFTLNWSANFLEKAYGLPQSALGRYLWLPPVLFDAGAILFGHVASRRAKARAAATADRDAADRDLVATAAALTALGGAMALARTPLEAVVLAGLAMAGGGGLFALLTADMLSRVPASAVSSAGGITAATQSLAYIVANPLVGWAVQRSGSYTSALVALAAWVVPGCVGWILWKPPPLAREPDRAAA